MTNNITHRINYFFLTASSFSKYLMVLRSFSDYFKINVRYVIIRSSSDAIYNYLIFAYISIIASNDQIFN